MCQRLESTLVMKITSKKYELVEVNVQAINTVNIETYRPPKTELEGFNTISKEENEILKSINTWIQ